MKRRDAFNQYSIPFTLALAMTASGCTSEYRPRDKKQALEPKADTTYCVDAPDEDVFVPYEELFESSLELRKVINFCKYDQGLQETVWHKIKEAEKTGLPPYGVMPDEFLALSEGQTTIQVTKKEAHTIYAAHVAHSLWLEENKIVPWSLLEYTEKQLEDLLQPKAWFNSWDDKKENYTFEYIVDYSSRETFQVAAEAVPTFSDQKTALVDIIKSVRSFRHGSFDTAGKTSDPSEIVTIPVMAQEKISRHGCQTMSPYVVQLANALNIPGEVIRGYHAADNHASALFEFTDQVLAHGDDPYIDQSNTPSSELLDNYAFWKENVLTYPIHNKTAAHNSMLHGTRNAIKYPSRGLLWGYCKSGERNLLNQTFLEDFGPFATTQELDVLENKILELSQNCTIFPDDNPDQ